MKTKLEMIKAPSLRVLLEEANSLGVTKEDFLQVTKEDMLFYMIYQATIEDED